jgi:putative chitinase
LNFLLFSPISGQTTMSLHALQTKIGVHPDGKFGPKTLRAAMNHFIMTREGAAHFFGQVATETNNFTAFVENLNYSTRGLQTTFKKYFPTEMLAEQYQRNPEKIANYVYANRMGNGNVQSGDGWKFRGRGALQLTGRNNYIQFAKSLRMPDILINPDIVATEYAFESAIFYFDRNDLWKLCNQGVDDKVILAVTRAVNGGTHGLESRKNYTNRFYGWLAPNTP